MSHDAAQRTTTDPAYLEHALAPYGPQVPLGELVEQLNRFYHAAEARDYDELHVEIFEELPPVWAQMVAHARGVMGATRLRILDFGCGTGFAIRQVLAHVPATAIECVTCYDPSPEMLERGKTNVLHHFPQAAFIERFEQIAATAPYNLLLTNSVLHHLPAIDETLRRLLDWLTPDAVWLAGHEPSARFYRNPECVRRLTELQGSGRWKRFLQPSRYVRRFLRMFGLLRSPIIEAAQTAVARGVLARTPPDWLVRRLVDFHVAHSAAEVARGRGLEIELPDHHLPDRWRRIWVTSYSFLGPHSAARLPKRWSEIAGSLAAKYPLDGANFCAVWQRDGRAPRDRRDD